MESLQLGSIRIASESLPLIALSLAVSSILFVCMLLWPASVFGYLFVLSGIPLLFVLYFFRDPERAIPPSDCGLVSPADGRIIDIRQVEENEFLKKAARRVSLFMSPLDVHVNRAPVSGSISYVRHRPGRFLSAFKEEASLSNEHVCLGIAPLAEGRGDEDSRMLVRLVAGWLARRIVVWKGETDTVAMGDRIGMIKFGSRVEIYVLDSFELTVRVGQRVKAGTTVIGSWRRGTSQARPGPGGESAGERSEEGAKP
jgi:phosphatidylserine decarboxylase